MTAPTTHKSLLTIILIVLLGGCENADNTNQSQAEAPHTNLSLNQWFDARYEEELQFSPVQLSFLGRKERNNELGSFSYAAFTEPLAGKKQATMQARDAQE